jgi:glucokinase
MFLGIEIGGTKLQLGIGADDGKLEGLWRGTVDVAVGPEGIRRQIIAAVPELLTQCGLGKCHLHGVGIGFGGPVDDNTQTVIKSHQIAGWDDFPLADWISDIVGVEAVLGNDADVAGLAEALHGAGKGLSPIFYITVGSGIGGGLIIDGEIYRGVGRGAAEIGYVQVQSRTEYFVRVPLEHAASGWAIGAAALKSYREKMNAREVVERARQGEKIAGDILRGAVGALAEAICHIIVLLCPQRIVIGGGVSLIGEDLFFKPLRDEVAANVFRPFAGLCEIVPAALGEEVVVHGAVALARKRFQN